METKFPIKKIREFSGKYNSQKTVKTLKKFFINLLLKFIFNFSESIARM
jgi:hypothetical protein